MVVNNLLDQTHVLQSPHGLSGQRSVDLHPLDEDGLRDHLVGGDLLEDLVAAGGKRGTKMSKTDGIGDRWGNEVRTR